METFCRNVALFGESNPLFAVTASRGGAVVWDGEVVSGDYDVVFVDGVERALLVHEYACKVVVVEDDAERMGAFLGTGEAEGCLQCERFQLSFIGGEDDYLRLAWEHVFLRSYSESLALKTYISTVHCVASDYRDFGGTILRNLRENAKLPLLDGAHLKDAFRGIPAIVCGAGPSLKKDLDPNTGLIFACGSAMGLLSDYHFGVALDPDPPLERFNACEMYAAPLLFQNRAGSHMLRTANGPLISFPPNGNFPIEDEIYGERGCFDTGWNAGTFGVALAHFLGCSPIYTSGIDGGYVCGKRYAEGIDADGTTDDLALGREWIAQFSPQELTTSTKQYDIRGRVQRAVMQQGRLESSGDFQKSRDLCSTLLDELIAAFSENHRGKQLLFEAELMRESFYQNHLEVIWKIWHWMIEREGAYRVELDARESLLNKALFLSHVVRNCHVG